MMAPEGHARTEAAGNRRRRLELIGGSRAPSQRQGGRGVCKGSFSPAIGWTGGAAVALVALFFSVGGVSVAKKAIALIDGHTIKKNSIEVDRLTSKARK